MDVEGAFHDFQEQHQTKGQDDDTPLTSLAYQEFEDQGRKFKLFITHDIRYQHYLSKKIMKGIYVDTSVLDTFGCQAKVNVLTFQPKRKELF